MHSWKDTNRAHEQFCLSLLPDHIAALQMALSSKQQYKQLQDALASLDEDYAIYAQPLWKAGYHKAAELNCADPAKLERLIPAGPAARTVQYFKSTGAGTTLTDPHVTVSMTVM